MRLVINPEGWAEFVAKQPHNEQAIFHKVRKLMEQSDSVSSDFRTCLTADEVKAQVNASEGKLRSYVESEAYKEIAQHKNPLPKQIVNQWIATILQDIKEESKAQITKLNQRAQQPVPQTEEEKFIAVMRANINNDFSPYVNVNVVKEWIDVCERQISSYLGSKKYKEIAHSPLAKEKIDQEIERIRQDINEKSKNQIVKIEQVEPFKKVVAKLLLIKNNTFARDLNRQLNIKIAKYLQNEIELDELKKECTDTITKFENDHRKELKEPALLKKAWTRILAALKSIVEGLDKKQSFTVETKPLSVNKIKDIKRSLHDLKEPVETEKSTIRPK